jgi:NitT/TauT family transport system ATP-binding protein
MNEEYKIVVKNLTKTFPGGREPLLVFKDLTIGFKKGKLTCIIGPSGCGKTTLFNILAGIESYDSGEILFDGKPIQDWSIIRKQVSYVFQFPRLLPWRTVKYNVMFSLKSLKKFPPKEWERLVEKYLELVGLKDFANAYPLQLSGGMQQRVGIARALVTEPEVLLMDEPFSNLDEITAKKLREDLLRIWLSEEEDKRRTIIFITHDISEAVYLAQEIVILSKRPAKFIGRFNIDVKYPREFRSEELVEYEREVAKIFYSKAM